MGGQIYVAIYNSDLECIHSNILINTEVERGILLYNADMLQDEIAFLYSKDYLTNCDLVIEKEIN